MKERRRKKKVKKKVVNWVPLQSRIKISLEEGGGGAETWVGGINLARS
jgi:hypothetical protein